MLGAIQQMLERTHNAVNTLRDRLSVVELALHQSRSEQERKEVGNLTLSVLSVACTLVGPVLLRNWRRRQTSESLKP